MEWIVYLLFLLVGFIMGRMTGKTVQGNTNILPEIKKPNLNPMNAYREKKEREELEQAQKEFNIMMENVNNYDGTSNHQQEVR